MLKEKIHVLGKDAYLLGEDDYGTKYYIVEFTWDCDWYWSGGYVQTYTNNRNPEKSKDIESHLHFDNLFFERDECGFDKFTRFFKSTPFTSDEIWDICELMKSFYICREYSDMLHRGGANYANNPVANTIKNETEYERINTEVIPAIAKELYKILEE